ncbi:endonuclease/exonuclease/phosphatase family protein [Streptomyces sp. NPDC001858]
MKPIRLAAVLLSGLLLAPTAPAVASAAPVVASEAPPPVSQAEPEEPSEPDTPEPDLSYRNRTDSVTPGLPDWSRVGYRGGADLPVGDIGTTQVASCRISAEELASKYKVIADDGKDDTFELQAAIDYIKKECSPNANFGRLSRIELPAGRIDVSAQIFVDASFLTIRGKGSDDGGTRIVFRPDIFTRYETLINGRWDPDAMVAGSGSDVGNGGWLWPGNGMFRVQARDVAERYRDDYANSSINRRDIFAGSVNQHWISGVKLAAQDDDPGFSARQGENTIRLDPKANMDKFLPNSYVWVGAANSRKFYEQQGITDTSMMESLHMRQQMFRVARIDKTAKTIRLDRPLEWDLPVDSLSDGSSPLGPNPYFSKVTPLKVVEGVGFEDFAYTQDMEGQKGVDGNTYYPTAAWAKNNYANLAPEYAMHGIVFKWAANSWARGLKATMTGSHPIVTEVARNLQIEHNSFDGAWNKGKGGNGYLRGSRVWDSLWAYNTIRNLRHFTFQWSASGNVAFRNDLDSDLNLHGGWEHDNLFEQNTVQVPFQHYAANCSNNCGGEGGQVDSGTWYPIWWAAGPKAGKWAGSSGPRNVFHNNILKKQLTRGGPFLDYAPYGTRAGIAYVFGSNKDDTSQFQHLSQDGQAIADWTDRENLDYQDKGVVALEVGNRQSLFLEYAGPELEPRPPGIPTRKVATWNMFGSNLSNLPEGGAQDRPWDYLQNLGFIDESDSNDNGPQVIALQEAGTPPGYLRPGAARRFRQTSYSVDAPGIGVINPTVNEYRLGTDGARPRGYVYWLQTDHRPTNGVGQMNLAIYTRNPAVPPGANMNDHVFVVPGAVDANGVSTDRPALGIFYRDTVYWTVHARSPGGADVATTLRQIRQRMSTAGPNGTPMPYVVLGDFNRTPRDLRGAVLPSEHAVWDPAGPTRLGRMLDYAVTAGSNQPNAIRVTRRSLVQSSETFSDHTMAAFNVTLPTQAEADPPGTGGAHRGKPRTNVRGLLGNSTHPYKNTLRPDPTRSSGEGYQARTKPRSKNDLPMMGFEFEEDPEYPGYYRLHHLMSDMYLGQVDRADAEVYTKGHFYGHESLWYPIENDDHTWTLINRHSRQALTLVGDQLFGRDWNPEDPNQRWFFQDYAHALDSYEFTDPQGQVLRPLNGTSEENAPLVMAPDTDDADDEFVVIEAPPRDGEDCFYVVDGAGRYLNSTSGDYGSPAEGNSLSLNAYHPDNDGYLFCSALDPRGQAAVLSQHSRFNEFVYVSTRALSTYVGLTYTTGSATLFRMKSKI